MSILPKHYTKILNNGLEVVAIPIKKGSNVISTDIFYKVGSRDEVMGKSGIAHMLEHLNFKSTKNLKSGEFDTIVKEFGGVNNASTGFDYTHYFIKSSSKNLEKSLELYSELMKNLKLTNKEFQPERDVVLEERRWRTDNSPIGYLFFRLFNNTFIYHSYHWTPIGFTDDIKNWKIQDIREFHKTYYSPNNAVLLVTGDIDPKEVFLLAQKHFEDIKPNPKKISHHQIEPKQDGAKRIEIFKESEVQMLGIAYKIPNFNHEDQIALMALTELLSSGKSSELYKVLVDEKKMVNQIYAYNLENKDPGVFLFIAVCNTGIKATEVEKEIHKIIDNIKKGNIDEDIIKRIQINTKASFIYSLENVSSIANLFGTYLALGDLKPLLIFEKSIKLLNKEQLIAAAKKYFNKKISTTIILRKNQ